MRITKSWGTNEYSFLYKKSVTGKEKSQLKLERFLENKTTFKVLLRSIITFHFIFSFFFNCKKLLCMVTLMRTYAQMFNALHPAP